MFDLKLTDIFSVICTGILTAALITYFYFIYNKFFVKSKFDNDAFLNWLKGLLKENYKESGYAILLIVVVYCLGIIGGDLTERMTDTDDSNKNFVLKELRFISGLKGEGDTRVEALVHDSLLTPLGTAVFRSEPVVKNANQLAGTDFFNEKNSLDIQWKKLDKEGRNRRNFNKFVQQIYYTGKNWIFFKNNEPLNELKSIQSRIDLSRSIVLLVTFSFQLLLLVILIYIIYLFSYKRKDILKWLNKPPGQFLKKSYYLFQMPMLIALFFLGLISRECYNINEGNFNKRAYGYYISDIQRLEYEKTLRIDSMMLVINRTNYPPKK